MQKRYSAFMQKTMARVICRRGCDK